MAREIAISVKGVSKDFKLPHEKNSSIKSGVVGIFKARDRNVEIQHALKNVSFEIEKGEFFGIVGRNGSGKSTLLKILAGIYTPTHGSAKTFGKVVPFIELGVGFNPELSGRDNVYLNGALFGFSRDEIALMYDDIVEFAELERFMDQKLKNYSSGMQVRLAFSIAIKAQGDILILDEVLAVGDESFQRKCFEYFATLKREKKTVVLVTHNMDSVLKFCTKAMLVDKGHKTEVGTPLEIAQIYRELNNTDNTTVNVSEGQDQDVQTKYIKADMDVKKEDGRIQLDLRIKQKVKLKDPVVVVNVFKTSGEQVYRWASDEKHEGPLDLSSEKHISITLQDIFPVDTFTVGVRVVPSDRTKDYATINNMAMFEIFNTTGYTWNTHWQPDEQSQIKDVA